MKINNLIKVNIVKRFVYIVCMNNHLHVNIIVLSGYAFFLPILLCHLPFRFKFMIVFFFPIKTIIVGTVEDKIQKLLYMFLKCFSRLGDSSCRYI